jgi:hypothetical protein
MPTPISLRARSPAQDAPGILDQPNDFGLHKQSRRRAAARDATARRMLSAITVGVSETSSDVRTTDGSVNEMS